MDEPDTVEWSSYRKELATGIQQLKSRGLFESARWCAELLQSIVSGHPTRENETTVHSLPAFLKDSKIESRKISLAQSYFYVGEYRRCALHLQDCENPKAVFLRNYALLKAGEEHRKAEEAELGEDAMVSNPELAGIQTELRRHYEEGKLDSFGVYLYATVLKHIREALKGEKCESKEESLGSDLRATSVDRSVSHPDKSIFGSEEDKKVVQDWSTESEAYQRALVISAIRMNPWNWAAWQALTVTIKDYLILSRVESMLPDTYMLKRFWWAQTLLFIRRDEKALEALLVLERDFPESIYVKSQLAVAQHNLRNADPAMDLFEHVRRHDPFRLDSMDIFSNILYIKDDRAALRHLAHHAFKVDKYNPITCCVVGNFYALSGEHTRAILFYLRALKLDPSYIDAWTLVGHEYIQLKDAHHAITAYRRAVDSDSKAYRAWYGLGQAYELLYMPQYALFYYERAAELRPHDSRMWCALGACYEVMGQLDNTLLCYHRAEANIDKEGNILHLLAELYKKLGRRDEAATYYARNLEAHERDTSQPQHIITALHFLAHYYKDQSNFKLAFQYSSRLVDFNGPEKEEIKSLMREMSATASSMAKS